MNQLPQQEKYVGPNQSGPQKYRITEETCQGSFEDILYFSAVCHLICPGNSSKKKKKAPKIPEAFPIIYPSTMETGFVLNTQIMGSL